jgi:hypothetical protein
MILRRTTRTTRARLARVVAGKLPRMLHRGRVRNANRHPFTDGKIAIAHGLSALADTRFMLRALRQAGCDDTATPAYSIERERAIQVRADKRDPTRSVVHVKRNANGKLVTVDLAAGFCRDDGHDVPLAQRWTDKAGQRAVDAILQAGQHRANMRNAVDNAIESVESANDAVKALLTMTKQTAATVAARAGALHANRAQSAMIRAELDEARAMASLSGKAKRKLRDQLRAAKYAAR